MCVQLDDELDYSVNFLFKYKFPLTTSHRGLSKKRFIASTNPNEWKGKKGRVRRWVCVIIRRGVFRHLPRRMRQVAVQAGANCGQTGRRLKAREGCMSRQPAPVEDGTPDMNAKAPAIGLSVRQAT